MNIILLSGGSGKRLWPLSNDIRSKQFIKVFRGPDGELESMVQRVYRQIRREAGEDVLLTIATSRSQVSAIRNQLPEEVRVSVEPCRRDTFPAIALACLYLYEEEGVDPSEPVIVCPVDPYVENSYFACFRQLYSMTMSGRWKLNLMGVKPTYPSEKYGYLVPEESAEVSAVKCYAEKPDLAHAEELLREGALWNCGIFAFRLEYMLEQIRGQLPYTGYRELYDHYAECGKISFDFAVGEKEPSAGVLTYTGGWKDIGSWNTFAEEMHGSIIGKGVQDEACKGTNIVNELDLPILAMGLSDVIIAASNDGILVADKHRSSYMKPYVEQMDATVRYAEKSWGSFTILDTSPCSMTLRVILMPGHRLHYHAHERRREVWTVIEGTGYAIVDGERIDVRPGSVVELPVLSRHTIVAVTALKVIEVQMGEDIRVSDKIKYPDPPEEGKPS